MELIGAPQTAVPLRAMIGLFERCARELDDRAFGLDVGFEMQRSWGFGLWGRYGALAPTLGSAIARYNRTFRAHASGGKLELIRRGCHWLWRHVRQDLDIPTIQHVDHRIGPMVALAREFLGQTWSPEWVEVSYPRDPEAHVMEDRLQIPVYFGCRGTGIVFRSEDLSARKIRKPVDDSKVITLREVVAEAVLSQAPEPARSLSAIVALRLLDGHTDIEGTARMAGLSVRSLQRQLLENGHSYREIVTVARRARAVGLLRETDRPIVDIAMLLGYADHASFTRAFHRWLQCSPSEFRRRGHRNAAA